VEACPVKSVAIITKKFKPDALEAGRAYKPGSKAAALKPAISKTSPNP